MTLGLPSLVQLIILVWHLLKTRGKKTAFWFLGTGLAFGILRSQIIHFIQINLNNSVIPYQFANNTLKIGNDSLQVYLGWITTAYLAWCFAEIILKNLKKNGFFKNTKEPEKEIFPILGFGFLFISTFSYLIETAASVMGWWHWNAYLEAGFAQSLFANVPWVGIVDWSTVAFEFLGLFLLTGYAFKNKKYRYLLIWLLPFLHWGSHVNSFNPQLSLLGQDFFLGNLVHLALPIIAFVFVFCRGVKTAKAADRPKAVWIAVLVTYFVCLLALLAHKDYVLLVALLPISFYFLAAKAKTNKLLAFGTFFVVIVSFLKIEPLLKQRLILAFYVLAAIAFLKITEQIKKFIDPRLKKVNGQFLIMLLGLTILIFIFLAGTKKDAAPAFSLLSSHQPNVIVVSLDNLRADRVGALNSSSVLTPNLDELAKTSSVYNNVYTAVPYTLPSHFSFFTGAYPQTTGIGYNSQNTLKEGFQPLMMAELFKTNGYQTSAFLGSAILDKPIIDQGFDVFDKNFTKLVSSDPLSATSPKINQRTAEEVSTAAISWLNENSTTPFFSFIHYFDMHAPYTPTCDFVPPTLKPDHSELVGADISTLNEKNLNFTENDYRYLEYLYNEEVRCTDLAFGELISYLKETEIYDKSLIIVFGDHGENFDHNKVFHGENIYEGAVRVPLVIKEPKQKTPKMETKKVSLIDVYPTLANGLKLKSTYNLDGQELSKAEREIYLETTPKKAAVSDKPQDGKIWGILENGLKLILSQQQGIEFYNPESDPDETKNLFAFGGTTMEELSAKINQFFGR